MLVEGNRPFANPFRDYEVYMNKQASYPVMFPVRLPAAQAQAVRRLAAETNTTASEVVRRAIGLFVSAQLSQPTLAKHDAA